MRIAGEIEGTCTCIEKLYVIRPRSNAIYAQEEIRESKA